MVASKVERPSGLIVADFPDLLGMESSPARSLPIAPPSSPDPGLTVPLQHYHRGGDTLSPQMISTEMTRSYGRKIVDSPKNSRSSPSSHHSNKYHRGHRNDKYQSELRSAAPLSSDKKHHDKKNKHTRAHDKPDRRPTNHRSTFRPDATAAEVRPTVARRNNAAAVPTRAVLLNHLHRPTSYRSPIVITDNEGDAVQLQAKKWTGGNRDGQLPKLSLEEEHEKADDESSKSKNDEAAEASDESINARELLQRAHHRLEQQGLHEERQALQDILALKEQELRDAASQLRLAVAAKCELLLSQAELERVTEQKLHAMLTQMRDLEKANWEQQEQRAVDEVNMCNSLAALQTQVDQLAAQHREDLDDWALMHEDEGHSKDLEIEFWRQELAQAKKLNGHKGWFGML